MFNSLLLFKRSISKSQIQRASNAIWNTLSYRGVKSDAATISEVAKESKPKVTRKKKEVTMPQEEIAEQQAETPISTQQENSKVDLEMIQQMVSKTIRKVDTLAQKIQFLQETSALMSVSVQMLAEQQVHQKVFSLLKQSKVYPAHLDPNTIQTYFTRINSDKKLEELLISYMKDSNVIGVEQAVKQTLAKQAFVDFDGQLQNYCDSAPAFSSWITSPLPSSAGKRSSSRLTNHIMLSGEVSVIGSSNTVARAFHRAMRIPLLLKRFTSRIHKTLYSSKQAESIEGLEKITVFVVTGSIHPNCIIPPRFWNRILSPTESIEFEQLEKHLLSLFDGSLSLPTNEELLEQYILSDPLKDALGAWRAVFEIELDDNKYIKLDPSLKEVVLMILLIRMAKVCKFDIYFGSCLNPLG